MSELDEAWALGLAQAEARARASGRTDIAEYLALRTSNDFMRKIGSEWLIDIFTSAAGNANRAGRAIQISSAGEHRFKIDHATMVGRVLKLTHGVRRLQVEVGWPRTPRDGFIRGGGLARAHIKHVGIKPADDMLRLVLNARGTPTWIVEPKHGEPRELHEIDVRSHVAILLQ